MKRIEAEQFVAEYFKQGKNATGAVKILDPELTQYSAENKASRLLNNAQVKLLIEDIEDSLKIGAIKGVKRSISLVDSKNEQVATTNIWKLIEHVRGTAVQRSEIKSTVVTIGLDLTN